MRRGRSATAAPPARSWSFDGPLGGALVLDARWRVIGPDRRNPSEHRFSVAEPTGAPTYPALVAAMSRALDGLSREIAGVLKAL